jgi:hypothetical protein
LVSALRQRRLPVPDELYLDTLIVELVGWWHGHALAPDIAAPAIDVLPDAPPRARRAANPFDDGTRVGWDPWNDEDDGE